MRLFLINLLLTMNTVFSFYKVAKNFRFTSSQLMSSRQIKQKTATIQVEDIYSDGWKLQDAIDILEKGGVGVLCTDTCYSIVTSIDSSVGWFTATKY